MSEIDKIEEEFEVAIENTKTVIAILIVIATIVLVFAGAYYGLLIEAIS